MLVIAELVKDIDKLVKEADCYIDKAIEYQEISPELSEIYFNKYETRMGEIDDSHNLVVDFVKQAEGKRTVSKEILDIMNKIWKFTHDSILEKIAHIESKASKYKTK